uniref:Bifunctional lysine-specific demethylase and histidyl-hydroxylase n=1 Tax=Fibrocapsa japonica TaxID=94617 RepID=A0A7S2XYX3_9STRA
MEIRLLGLKRTALAAALFHISQCHAFLNVNNFPISPIVPVCFQGKSCPALQKRFSTSEVCEDVGMDNVDAVLLSLKRASQDSAQATPLDVTAAFRALANTAQFGQDVWQQEPFVFSEGFPNMVGAYTMLDIEEAVEEDFLEAGRGLVDEDGRAGWQMARVGKGKASSPKKMKVEDVRKALSQRSGTVVFNSAGANVPALSGVCLDVASVLQLPTNLNLYLTAAGQTTSAPPHTDKQDVFVVQTQGQKHWRVFAPPEPKLRPAADPFVRGKGRDVLSLEELGEPLIDTVLSPGQVLYVPAGFPHTTDTVQRAEGAEDEARLEDPSVHLTIGVDTHIWGLNYAGLRGCALRRAGLEDLLDLEGVEAAAYWDLQRCLPLGFLSQDMWRQSGRYSEGKRVVVQSMVQAAARKMSACEPGRWTSPDLVVQELGPHLEECAGELLEHHTTIWGILRTLYEDQKFDLSDNPSGLAVVRSNAYFAKLEAAMAKFTEWGSKPSAPAVEMTTITDETMASSGMSVAEMALNFLKDDGIEPGVAKPKGPSKPKRKKTPKKHGKRKK